MKCNQSRPGFELESPCSFPTTITTTPRAPFLLRGIPHNECPRYDTKQFDDEVPVMLGLSGMWCTPSLPSLSTISDAMTPGQSGPIYGSNGTGLRTCAKLSFLEYNCFDI